MARIKTVSVEYRKKIQGEQQYESNTVGIQLWADLDVDDDVDAVMHQLWAMATENVKAKVLSLRRRQVAILEDTFLGMPAYGPPEQEGAEAMGDDPDEGDALADDEMDLPTLAGGDL